MVDEVVGGEAHDLDRQAQSFVVERRVRQRLEHGTAEAAGDDALLERHDQLLAPRVVRDEGRVEWLCEARVDHGDGPAVGGESVGNFQPARNDRPKANDQDLRALAE